MGVPIVKRLPVRRPVMVIALLVVLVEVAREQFDTDQALAAVFERHKDAERLHAGHLRVKFFANEALHIGRDIQLVDVALALIRGLFAREGLRCRFFA